MFPGTEAAACLSTTETTTASVSLATDKDENKDPTQQVSSARVPPAMVTDMEEERKTPCYRLLSTDNTNDHTLLHLNFQKWMSHILLRKGLLLQRTYQRVNQVNTCF